MAYDFKLSNKFVEGYRDIPPPFGFNGLGELTYRRTYSRIKEDGTNEEWFETVRRVVEGTYSIQRRWIEQHRLGWNQPKAQKSAQEMYDLIFNMKFLPPGRGLWIMGTPIIEEKGLGQALNNCGMVSTANIKDELAKPFAFMMDMSMVGVGVGFDVAGAGKIKLSQPQPAEEWITIEDSREGWVNSLVLLLESYFVPNSKIIRFDYSEIRPAGEPIRGFGGVASGPAPLMKLHEQIVAQLDGRDGEPITVRDIADIMNQIGACVVAGNVRRSAQIALGDGFEFSSLKDYEWNGNQYVGDAAARAEWGWASNNSISINDPYNWYEMFARRDGGDLTYAQIAERIAKNGEPGIFWLDNARKYGRMGKFTGERFDADRRIVGTNPCGEQSLENYEVCNLVETFPARHEDITEYTKTLKYAYLYAKTVSLVDTTWPETNRVMLRNRRIGTSMSGLQQLMAKYDVNNVASLMQAWYRQIEEYDSIYSDWFCVPTSVKITSIKPSGTVSLLAGATPGMHWPESRFYIRRVRLSNNSALLGPLIRAGYHVEPAVGQEDSTVVVEFPVDSGEGVRSVSEVSMWEQLEFAAFLQENWADNQVSCTITFQPHEAKDIGMALQLYSSRLKGISMLPQTENGVYAQMPYEQITEEDYQARISLLKPIDYGIIRDEEAEVDKFCNNDHCEVVFPIPEQES